MNKPFLKWAGGKIKLLPKLKELGIEQGKRYIEPFVGSGAIALNMPHEKIIIGDTNEALINLWGIVSMVKDKMIDDAREVFTLHYNNKNPEHFYYDMRGLFNELNEITPMDNESTAGLFLYLNRHCFNGLCRFNKKGEFNVPYGRYKTVYFPEKELFAAIEVSKRMVYPQHCSFRDMFSLVKAGDVVFNDPPYIPLSKTASFTTYSQGGFTPKDHEDLVTLSKAAAKRGATIFITNHDTPYTRELYKDANYIESIDVARNISCKGNSRKAVKELVVIYK